MIFARKLYIRRSDGLGVEVSSRYVNVEHPVTLGLCHLRDQPSHAVDWWRGSGRVRLCIDVVSLSYLPGFRFWGFSVPYIRMNQASSDGRLISSENTVGQQLVVVDVHGLAVVELLHDHDGRLCQ